MKKIQKKIRQLQKVRWLRFLYPRRCPICDRVLGMEEQICVECSKMVRTIRGAVCIKCGKKLRDETQEFCGDCRKISHIFDGGRALYEYSSVRGSLYRFKYKGRREYAQFYGKMIADTFGREIARWHPDVITSVPLHKARMRKRGYNQAALLAQKIGEELSIPVDNDIIKRVKKTTPLKMLTPAERKNNLKNAFKMPKNNVKLSSILIIDDIYTTGATLDAVSRVMRDADVRRIYFLTIAIGREN